MHASSTPQPAPARGQRGFSLIELLVALFVLAEILIAAAILFNANNRLSRVQTQVADMQQSLRVGQMDMVRLTRMAGRGGLPIQALDNSVIPAVPRPWSVEVRNNVAASSTIIAANAASPPILEGTDVLTVRGVFDGDVYTVNWTESNGGSYSPPDGSGDGSVQLCYRTLTGSIQDLRGLEELLPPANPTPRNEALILVSAVNDRDYAVVELDASNSAVGAASCNQVTWAGATRTGVTLRFKTQGVRAAQYLELAPNQAFPGNLTGANGVAYVGVLEEHRFFIRDDLAATGKTMLTRSRFFPNTEVPHPDGNLASLRVDLAENFFDLQVALGYDRNADGRVTEAPDLTDRDSDEWMFNAAGEAEIQGVLLYTRISSIARSSRPDPRYEAPDLLNFEDRVYTAGVNDPLNGSDGQRFRRRIQQTQVALRNPFQVRN